MATRARLKSKAKNTTKKTTQARKAVPKVLDLQTQSAVVKTGLPTQRRLQQWAEAAYRVHHAAHAPRRKIMPVQVSLRIVGVAEGRKLNRQWRESDYATNILSFPAGEMLEHDAAETLLGDLVICAPVIKREAREQGKTLDAHWAHMMIHGVLHLLGYDHENDRDAQVMEACEVALLEGFGFPDPYQPVEASE